MPYYNKPNGAMLDSLWDSHIMEVVTIQQLAAHRTTVAEFTNTYAQNCLRCITTMALEEAITKFIEEKL